MKNFAALLIVLLSSTVFAQQDQKLPDGKWAFYGEEFYSIKSSTKTFPRELLSKILNSHHLSTKGKFDVLVPECEGVRATCYQHVSVGYTQARKIMFGELDIQKDAQGTFVVDVYCGKKFYFKNVDSVSSMHSEINIEHTWPQSKFNGAFSKDMQKSDMHHLYLTDSKANSVRGNNPFGLVRESEDRMAGEGCRVSRFGFMDSGEVYTPPASHRGNVARALFYFAMHYDLPIKKSEETILREWHKNDPVDANEIKRHEGIAKYEKIRNPFVDHPEIADRISDF